MLLKNWIGSTVFYKKRLYKVVSYKTLIRNDSSYVVFTLKNKYDTIETEEILNHWKD